VQNINQDGYLEGRLDQTYFNNSGTLIGSYSNGQTRQLYKLAIARFAVDNKLEAVSGNMFEQTRASGAISLSPIQGGFGGRTELVVGALESSNVDLADQFSKMIITQRAYTSNATVLRTADEMTMAARDLKR
jgi:flagellar hook protein FlgE